MHHYIICGILYVDNKGILYWSTWVFDCNNLMKPYFWSTFEVFVSGEKCGFCWYWNGSEKSFHSVQSLNSIEKFQFNQRLPVDHTDIVFWSTFNFIESLFLIKIKWFAIGWKYSLNSKLGHKRKNVNRKFAVTLFERLKTGILLISLFETRWTFGFIYFRMFIYTGT